MQYENLSEGVNFDSRSFTFISTIGARDGSFLAPSFSRIHIRG